MSIAAKALVAVLLILLMTAAVVYITLLVASGMGFSLVQGCVAVGISGVFLVIFFTGLRAIAREGKSHHAQS